MTSGHFLYIPAVAILGMILGFVFGTRAAADRINFERKRDAEREAAKQARLARKAAASAEDNKPDAATGE